MQTDYIFAGGGAFGSVAERLVANNMQVNVLRPYTENGHSFITNSQGYAQMLTSNAATLRKDEWVKLDTAVIQAARPRLKAWTDLGSLSGTYGGFNGMGSMVLESESQSDPGEASVSFDGLVEGRNDSPLYQLEGLPLPITHSDFFMSARRRTISQTTGSPIDTSMAEAAARRVAEKVEQTTIGTITGAVLDPKNANDYRRTPRIHGYVTFPDRLVKADMSDPTDAGWDPSATVHDVLDALEALRENFFYGPFVLYHSPDWQTYLDGDYYRLESSGAVAPTKTLRSRLKEIEDIRDVKRLDFLIKPFTFVFVQMTTDVARAVNGLNITTVQWETKGGMQLNFKVMCIHVPQLRSDFYGNCGILEATVGG
jgi:hypothetical protein